MKITKIISSLPINKKYTPMSEKELSKYIRISAETFPIDKTYQLNQSREVIANYLKKQGLSCDIFDARELLGEHDSIIWENKFANNPGIRIKNNLNNKSSDTVLLPNPDESFLRQVYQTVEHLAKKVSK